MRFSTCLLAAGLSALTFSAPVDRDRDDECDWEPEPNKKVHKPTHSSKIKLHSTVPIPTSSSAIKSTATFSTSTIVSVSTSASLSEYLATSSSSTTTSSSDIPLATYSSTTLSSSAISSPASSYKSPTSTALSTFTSISISISSPAVELLAAPSSSTFTSSTSSPLATLATSIMPSSTVKVPTASSSTAAASSSTSKSGALQWLGANESGAEFGSNIPGVLGTDYIFPDTASIQTLMNQGMNIFRVPFLMERLAQGTITSALDAAYLSGLQTVVSFITAAGAHAVLDPHNYGRYDGNVITSTSDFQTFWTNVATEFKSNDKVIFDCNNEFHDMPSNELVVALNQACIDGVRAAGATTQYIFVEGTAWSGAWTWITSGNSDFMGNLTDPYNKIVYEMHQYLDSDASGTSSTCVSTTIGAERIAAATAWLRANNKKGILGEFAGGVNSQCEIAVTGMLDALVASNDVWLGALWWGAGPWWGDYIYSLEPPSGTAYGTYIDILTSYV